nr:hypothetical protein [Actinomadura madurae]
MPPPPGDARPDADRLGALLVGEGRGDDGEGDRHDHRRARPGEEARGEHDLRGRGQARGGARHPEHREAGEEHRLAAPPVADRAEREQQRGEAERVDVDHP